MENKSFEKLWENTEVKPEGFDNTLTEKMFNLSDDKNKYILFNKDNKTEVVEAASVEEALSKASLSDIIKIYHSRDGENNVLIDNNLLKSEKTT